MNYEILKIYFHEYRMGRMTKYQMECAIFIWQRSLNEK